MTVPGRGRLEIRLTDPAALGELLNRIRTETGDLAAAVATTRDGLVIASSLDPGTPEAGAVADHASALAAAAVGVGARFVSLTNHGRLKGMFLEGDRGCVTVQPLSETLILILVGLPGIPMGRFTLSVRRASAILTSPDI